MNSYFEVRQKAKRADETDVAATSSLFRPTCYQIERTAKNMCR